MTKTLLSTGTSYHGTVIHNDGQTPAPYVIFRDGERRFASMAAAEYFIDSENDLASQGYESGMQTRRSLGL